jgi:hypothetical protein
MNIPIQWTGIEKENEVRKNVTSKEITSNKQQKKDDEMEGRKIHGQC